MTDTAGRLSSGIRATSFDSKGDLAREFMRRGSAQVLVAIAAVLILCRLVVGGFGRGDGIVVVATLIIAGPVEWLIHRTLLHAPADAWASRTLGTGFGHRRHHLDPPDVDWLMLRGIDAVVFVAAFGVVTAGWSIPLLVITGSSILGPFLTAWTLTAVGLAHYEWVHLLVHTRYRCRSRYYGRLARNHRLHHFRNERYWLGVTTNSGDRLLGTYPRDKSDVPLSETARTLENTLEQQ